MKKISQGNYKRDKYYTKVTKAVHECLKQKDFITPVDILIKTEHLTEENYNNWRVGKIPYLEKVINCNLSKINRILRILKNHSIDRGLKPSNTIYKKWGKGIKKLLQFSKTSNPLLEELYSTHYIKQRRKDAMNNKDKITRIKQELIKLTSEFCNAYLDEEYRRLSEKLILKMSRKRNVPFLSGRINVWAAGVIYSLGRSIFFLTKASSLM